MKELRVEEEVRCRSHSRELCCRGGLRRRGRFVMCCRGCSGVLLLLGRGGGGFELAF